MRIIQAMALRRLHSTEARIRFDSIESSLDMILRVYNDRNLRLNEFVVCLSEGEVYNEESASLLNKWVPVIVENMCPGRFDLTLNLRGLDFQLPSLSSIFQSHSIRELFLGRCVLESSAQVRFDLKRLQILKLDDVHVPQQILDNILSNSPLIEDVSLWYCKGVSTINLLSNNKLTHLNIRGDDDDDDIDHDIDDVTIRIGNEIQALRNVKIRRCFLSFSNNEALELAHLTRLSLTRVRFSFTLFSCNLHCLKELHLVRCSNLKELKLSSRSMERLFIKNISMSFKATVHAPSIVNFYYKGVLPQSVSFADSGNVWKSKIYLGSSYGYDPPVNPSHCCSDLYGLLKALTQSEISLELDEVDVIRFYEHFFGEESLENGSTNEDVGDIVAEQLPVALEHLWIKRPMRGKRSYADFLLKRLFHVFRPSYVFIARDMIKAINKHREITESMFKERETMQRMIWERVLEGVSLQVLYQNQRVWKPVEYSSYAELRKKVVAREVQLRFNLKWRE